MNCDAERSIRVRGPYGACVDVTLERKLTPPKKWYWGANTHEKYIRFDGVIAAEDVGKVFAAAQELIH